MTPQKVDSPSPSLEVRVEALEAELAQLKQLLLKETKQEKPWWEVVAGSFEDDPTFEAASRYGREWRQSAE